MYFVPEGQHDRSQARSAWSHEENSPVPAGRLNGSRLNLDTNIPFNRNTWRFLHYSISVFLLDLSPIRRCLDQIIILDPRIDAPVAIPFGNEFKRHCSFK